MRQSAVGTKPHISERKCRSEYFADYLTFEFSIAADALLNHQLARIGRHNRQRRIGEGAAQETRRPNENEPLQHLDFERTRPGTSFEHGSELCR